MGKENQDKLADQDIEVIEDNNPDEIDVNNLSLEDIEALEKKEEGATKSEPKPKPDPEKEGAEDKDKGGKQEEPDDKRTDFEKEIDAENDPVKLKERLKGLQGLATKSKQELAQLRKDLQETKSKLQEKLKSDFEELDEEQLDELRKEDPDAYIEYQKAKEKHDADVKEAEAEYLGEQVKLQADEAVNFIEERFGVRVDMSVPPDQQSEEVQKLMAEDGPLYAIDNYLKDNVVPKDGVYTSKQMNDAYKVLYHDQIIADARKGIREKTVDDIERASKGGSKLDKAGPGGGTNQGALKIDDLTQEEINNLSEAELDRILENV